MAKLNEVILLAEHGWQGMRHCALDFAQEGHHVTVLIKGRPSKEVRKFLSKKPHIKNYFISIKLFSMIYPFILFYKKILKNIHVIVYQTSKAEKIVKLLVNGTECKGLKDQLHPPYYSFQ